jgi:redox-sensitive bicupin YhaK (pirin superfamily)
MKHLPQINVESVAVNANPGIGARELAAIVPAVAASDGAGVKLRRSLGSGQNQRHDPFLMLDEFFSDDPNDYIAGFPSHPHRGFETITYMLDGHMRHEDSHGNRGDLGPGDAQWMTAARGIIHSEMPQQTAGRMRGFQLWLNLPAAEKMKPASYRDIAADEIPSVRMPGVGLVRVIAGELHHDAIRTSGPIAGITTQPIFFDIHLEPGAQLQTPLPPSHNAFLYVYEGEAAVGQAGRALPFRSAGILGDGARLLLRAGQDGARLLLLAGLPLREPIVQYGPFVMNTREQIEQAIGDYQRGELVR